MQGERPYIKPHYRKLPSLTIGQEVKIRIGNECSYHNHAPQIVQGEVTHINNNFIVIKTLNKYRCSVNLVDFKIGNAVLI